MPVTSDIAHMIEDLGHSVTSRHVVKKETTDGAWEKRYDPRRLFEREMRRLATSDILIAEVTTPSYGGGFLIETALTIGKPVLSLHYGDNLEEAPLMLRGHPHLNLQMYTEENVRGVLKKFFEDAKKLVVEPLPDFDQ